MQVMTWNGVLNLHNSHARSHTNKIPPKKRNPYSTEIFNPDHLPSPAPRQSKNF